MAKKYSANNSGRGVTAVMILIIAVVFVLGAFTVYNSVHTSKLKDKLDSYNATITQRADALGMETEDFLKLYGLADSGLKGSDSEQDAYEKMTLANYVKYSKGGTELTEDELAEFKDEMAEQIKSMGITDEITPETTDLAVKGLYAQYAQQKQEEAQAAQEAAQSASGETVPDDAALSDETADGAEESAE